MSALWRRLREWRRVRLQERLERQLDLLEREERRRALRDD